MKIEKLITLSQYVSENSGFTIEPVKAEVYEYIVRYNDFLNQPLTKDIFINPIEHPNKIKEDRSAETYNKLQKQWQEAENKVMFTHDNHRICVHRYYNMGDYRLFIDSNLKFNISNNSKIGESTIETLHDLAEATNGTLTLKNVTI